MPILAAVMIEDAYTITRMSAGNLGDLRTLHTAVYGRVLPADLFPKKYDTAYTGVAYVGYIAYNKAGLPVAFYGVIPCFMRINGETMLSAQSADTMTHPAYRNKGLFVRLAELTYTLCKAIGISFIFGFPNQNSLPGFINKLGWQTIGTMDCFVIPLKALPLEKLALKFPFLKRLYKSYAKRVLKNYATPLKGLPGSVLADGLDGVLRDANYLQNKAIFDTKVIKIDAVLVWFCIKNGLILGDFASISDENFDKTMKKLLKLARISGLWQVQFHAGKGTALHRLFAERYAPIPSFPVIFKDLGAGISFDNIKFTFADIDIF